MCKVQVQRTVFCLVPPPCSRIADRSKTVWTTTHTLYLTNMIDMSHRCLLCKCFCSQLVIKTSWHILRRSKSESEKLSVRYKIQCFQACWQSQQASEQCLMCNTSQWINTCVHCRVAKVAQSCKAALKDLSNLFIRIFSYASSSTLYPWE